MKILALATQGAGGNDENRITQLLGPRAHERFAFSRARKLASFCALLARLRRERQALVVMEGTGLAGGLALIAARWLFGTRYVVSTGDAIAPYFAGRFWGVGPLFSLYERALYRAAAGVVAWSPYLIGRIASLGGRRTMTAPGWSSFRRDDAAWERRRSLTRQELGIRADEICVGIIGNLDWNTKRRFAYGWDLVQAATRAPASRAVLLIVGEGSGRARMEALARQLPPGGPRALFTGHVPRDRVPDYLAALDVASLPQSHDALGALRLTTKLPEYREARLPVVTTQVPLAYDLDEGEIWRVPGGDPWEVEYFAELGRWLEGLTPAAIAGRREKIRGPHPLFDRDAQVRRFGQFIDEILAEILAESPTETPR